MKAVFFILNDAKKLTELLAGLNKAGIFGTTICSASGMGTELSKLDDFNQNFGLLRRIVQGTTLEHKIMIFVIDENKLTLLIETIESIVGNLENEGSGLLFTTSVDFVKGLKY